MVPIKEAAQRAIAFAEDTLGAERCKGARIEEVASTTVDGQDVWVITLSMLSLNALEVYLTEERSRVRGQRLTRDRRLARIVLHRAGRGQ